MKKMNVSIFQMLVRFFIAISIVVMLFPLVFLASFSMKDSTAIFDVPLKILPEPAKSVTIVVDYSDFAGEDSDAMKDKLLRDSTMGMYIAVSGLNHDALGEVKFIGTMDGKNIFYQRAHVIELRKELDYGIYKGVSVMDDKRLLYKDKYIKSADKIGYTYNLSGIKKGYDINLLGKSELEASISTLYDKNKNKGLIGNYQGATVTANGFLLLENFKYYTLMPSYMYSDIPNIAKYSFLAFAFNTLLVMAVAFVTQVGLCSTTAYSLSRLFSRRMSKVLLLYFLGTMMIPFMCILIPQSLLMNKIGAHNNYWAMTLPYLYPAAAYIILFKGFFDRLPQDLLDAAKIDGASEVYVFTRIIMPLSKSITAVVGLNCLIGAWNDFFWYNFAANRTSLWTINLALYNISMNPATDSNVIMGLSFMTILPVVILSLIFSKQIKESVVGAAIKG